MTESGTLACTAAGGLLVHVEAERCRIAPEDVRSLIFSGQPGVENLWFSPAPVLKDHRAPVTRERVRRTGGIVTSSVTIEGHAAVNPAGRAVVFRLRAGSWIVPLVSFQRVARGEAASAPLFPLVPEVGRC